jgi:hypothetical protein
MAAGHSAAALAAKGVDMGTVLKDARNGYMRWHGSRIVSAVGTAESRVSLDGGALFATASDVSTPRVAGIGALEVTSPTSGLRVQPRPAPQLVKRESVVTLTRSFVDSAVASERAIGPGTLGECPGSTLRSNQSCGVAKP